MSTLQQTLQSIAADFASKIVEALRGVSIDDLVTVTGGRQTGTPKSVAPTPKKGGRLGRRSEGDLAHTLQRIVSILEANPSGLRAEQIREILLLDRRELPRPIALGLETGKLSKSGAKRATVYTLGSSAGALAPKKKTAKKKAAAKK